MGKPSAGGYGAIGSIGPPLVTIGLSAESPKWTFRALRAGATLVGLLLALSCSGGSNRASATNTTTARTTATTTAPTTSATDPLDAAFAAAGYQTPIADEVRVAVTTFCRSTAADLAANVTNSLRGALRIGFQVMCPERLAELDAVPARG